MKHIRLFIVAGLLLALAVPAMAASASSPLHMNNRLRLGYDDNVYQEDSDHDPDSSTRIVEEIEVLANLNMERTYLGLRYRPSLLWYQDREPDDTDVLHDLDLNFIHTFSPVLSLSLNDTLRAGQLPELQDDGYIVRQEDDNVYNSAIGTLSYNLRPETRIDVSGRHIMLAYNEDENDNNNYYSVVGGLTLRQQLASRTTVMADGRYQTLVYNDADDEHNRDAETLFAGLGLEQTFSPQLIGSLRAGVENRTYDDDYYDDNAQPYGELSMTFLPTPATRITGAASYSIYESDVAEYLSANRTYLSLSFAHDFTTKLSVYLSSGFAFNAYEADYALDEGLEDADETSYLVSARATYRVNRINWIEAGYQYVMFDSDVSGRESYERNRIDVGWKIQLF
ncbi:MAG: outer membrane beta-barrel protein [Kiritimatiellia bacterium]